MSTNLFHWRDGGAGGGEANLISADGVPDEGDRYTFGGSGGGGSGRIVIRTTPGGFVDHALGLTPSIANGGFLFEDFSD